MSRNLAPNKILILFLFIIAISSVWVFFPTKVHASEPEPAFRILNIKADYGHMVFEIEHMNPDGSHAYWENYTVQGIEWFKKDYVRDDQGRVLLTNGEPAPRATSLDGSFDYPYLPPGQEYKRSEAPLVDLTGVINAATRTHIERAGTDWEHGEQRLNTYPLDTIGADQETDEGHFENSDKIGAEALVQWFQPHLGKAFSIIDGEPQPYLGDMPVPDLSIGQEYGTVGVFYPDSPGGDGYSIGKQNDSGTDSGTFWATLRALDPGQSSNNNANHFSANVILGTGTDKYRYMARSFVTFPTATLPDSAIISAGTIGVVGMYKTENTGQALAFGWTSATTAYPESVGNSTFAEFLDTRQVTDILTSNITTDYSTYTDWTLNGTGISYVSKDDVTKYAMRLSSDIDNTAPTWTGSCGGGDCKPGDLTVYSDEEDGAGDNRPTLSLTYTNPSAALTGTITSSATEQSIRDGGTTALITLTDATWVAAGGTFDAQRQNIIDGLDSAQSETNGWNNEVRDELGVSAVVRTSDTLVTITIPAADVGDYRITSNETITVTVPASATSAAGALTASPTALISASTETAAISGTLSDGGTPAEIRAGGQTIIITLANTTWVDAGSDFNAQRQNIIDGIASNLSEPDGWNARRSDFPVTDVVRTSATVTTITLSASSGYGISEAETLTVTVPASAIDYGAALTGTPTMVITPTFAASGTWVSPAINTSSITNVAYCALGWNTTLPASTSVTVEYSTDGGSNYSSATNGSCPFSAGTNLSSVTDLRIKATLATSNSDVTPSVNGLGVVFGNVDGQTLRYQLNATPDLTITDRTGNGYAGTMSFPSQPTGVSTTVGSMTTQQSPASAQTARGVPQVVSPVTGAAVSNNLFNLDETGWAALPGYDMVNTMSSAGSGLPVQFIWYLFLGFITIMLGFFALNMTQSLFAAGGAMAIGIGASMAIGGGLMPGWIIFAFLPIALGLVLLRPRLAI